MILSGDIIIGFRLVFHINNNYNVACMIALISYVMQTRNDYNKISLAKKVKGSFKLMGG